MEHKKKYNFSNVREKWLLGDCFGSPCALPRFLPSPALLHLSNLKNVSPHLLFRIFVAHSLQLITFPLTTQNIVPLMIPRSTSCPFLGITHTHHLLYWPHLGYSSSRMPHGIGWGLFYNYFTTQLFLLPNQSCFLFLNHTPSPLSTPGDP